MTTELPIIPAEMTIADYKAALGSWVPRSDQEAGDMIAFMSMLSGKDGKAAKEAATARLLARCESRDCEELAFEGFKLKMVYKTQPQEVSSPKLEKIDAEIADLEDRIRLKKIDRSAEVEKLTDPNAPVVKVFSHFLVQPSK